MALGTIKYGLDHELEEQALNLLMKDRKNKGLKAVQVNSEEYGWLSTWQLDGRQDREVYNTNGYPSPEIVEGRVFRAYNPLFGKRPRRPAESV